MAVKHNQQTQVHAAVVQRITAGIEAYGLKCQGVTESPLKGDKSGNTEFLAHFTHDPSTRITVPPDAVRDEGGDFGRGAGGSLGGSGSAGGSSGAAGAEQVG